MASPAYRAHSRTSYATGLTSVTITKPTGTVDGDGVLLVVTLYEDASALNSERTITWPAGFTEVFSGYQGHTGGHECQMAAAKKIASSEGASWAPSWTGAADGNGAAISYSGVYNNSAWVEASGLTEPGSESANVSCPDVTAVSTDTLIVTMMQHWTSDGAYTAPSGFTERYPGASTAGWSFADKVLAATGSAGGAFTYSSGGSSSTVIGATLLIASQAAAAGSPTGNVLASKALNSLAMGRVLR